MEKLFISLPMKDKTNEQIRVKREKLHHDAQRILGHEVELIDTFFEDVPHDATPLYYLSKAIELMGDAKYVMFASDWKSARGCRVEHLVAKEYGKEILREIM